MSSVALKRAGEAASDNVPLSDTATGGCGNRFEQPGAARQQVEDDREVKEGARELFLGPFESPEGSSTAARKRFESKGKPLESGMKTIRNRPEAARELPENDLEPPGSSSRAARLSISDPFAGRSHRRTAWRQPSPWTLAAFLSYAPLDASPRQPSARSR